MLGRVPSGFPSVVLAIVLTVSSVTSCTAQLVEVDNCNTNRPSRERTLVAESFSRERLAMWQKRLKLEDWNISVIVARTTDLKPRTLGNIHWDSDKKTAVIRVLDPADYKLSDPEILKDIEFTVVHELIHLKLSPLLSSVSRSEASRSDEERTVNSIADALLGR